MSEKEKQDLRRLAKYIKEAGTSEKMLLLAFAQGMAQGIAIQAGQEKQTDTET